jgi:metal-sulfur cluster biosynthetic enzyme
MTKIALKPSHPERVCWGCDQHCRADALACGNGTERTQHPIELFGDDWLEWAREEGGHGDFDPSMEGTEPNRTNQELMTAGGEREQLRDSALEALRQVIDPELGVNIVDLGLVYRLAADADGRIEVDLSMTTPACPLGEHLLHEVEDRLQALESTRTTQVRLVWDPPWSPARMSEQARATLGWLP